MKHTQVLSVLSICMYRLARALTLLRIYCWRVPGALIVTSARMAKPVIIALGIKIAHWLALVEECPSILNCCIDVRKALGVKSGETAGGSGFDERIRRVVKMKPAWSVVWEVAMWIFSSFGTLLVVCSHGKHRSLSLAYEIAMVVDCELISPLYSCNQMLSRVEDILLYIRPRLMEHARRFGHFNYPIHNIGVCKVDFDGPKWMNSPGEGVRTNPEHLHVLHTGDLVVEWTKPATYDGSWSRGTVIHGLDAIHGRWFPPSYVTPLEKFHFRDVENLQESLMCQWNACRRSRAAPEQSGVDPNCGWVRQVVFRVIV